MTVGKICQRNVVTVRPFDDLTTAAQLMRERHVGYLVVVDPHISDRSMAPVGVLTDRDIVVSVVARETDSRMLSVGDAMTRQPVVANESDPVSMALESMRRIGVRRLPVVGDRGELVGILAIDDILDSVAGDLQHVAAAIRNQQSIETVLRP
jgi:CBS domain-containing protein